LTFGFLLSQVDKGIHQLLVTVYHNFRINVVILSMQSLQIILQTFFQYACVKY